MSKIRMQCLEMAYNTAKPKEAWNVLDTAMRYMQFIETGCVKPSEPADAPFPQLPETTD